MKWIKRLLILIGVVLTAMIAVGLGGLYLYRAAPPWYGRGFLTVIQSKDAANRADQTLLDVFSWAASAQAQEIRRMHHKIDPHEPPIGAKTVTFDEQEINSFVLSWQSSIQSTRHRDLSSYFSGGRLILQDDAVILAGQSAEFDTVVSADFAPSIDDQGKLLFPLEQVRAGRLPIPRFLISDRLQRLHALLAQQLRDCQRTANIDPTLTANSSAVAAGWVRLLLCALDNQPDEAVIFIPVDMNDLRRALPVKLTAVTVAQGSITLTLEPISMADRIDILTRLKDPYVPPPGR
jgi:hypothetical protein